MTEAASNEVNARTVQGKVTSIAMDKSITVEITRRVRHPKYRKYIQRNSKIHAHDESNECQLGDIVRIRECRPLSKTKSWTLVDVVERAS